MVTLSDDAVIVRTLSDTEAYLDSYFNSYLDLFLITGKFMVDSCHRSVPTEPIPGYLLLLS